LEQYVSDCPYIASSFLSVAISQLFGTALAGRCKSHSDLCQMALPLAVKISVLPYRSGERFLRQLFEPLGYEVTEIAGMG
jgi:RNA repair, ligase-Pnkp-associating, region of Hen1